MNLAEGPEGILKMREIKQYHMCLGHAYREKLLQTHNAYIVVFIYLVWPIQGNGEDSFEELQELFEEMFHRDMNGFGSSSQTSNVRYQAPKSSAPACNMSSSSNNKRNCSGMSSAKANGDGFFSSDFSCLDGGRSFCLGVS